ncbi:uncharacterized protein VTP21DRAFT_48 [Calcarisporiella thermophila]|uniref:uncharacterized protein n=1 Tax=Calcarisporiella thermophila TaxID=911321 RepID=UPI0037447682
MDRLENLNSQQREAISQFQSVTHIDDLNRAIAILEQNHWNMEAAVQSVFDGASEREPLMYSRSSATSNSNNGRGNGRNYNRRRQGGTGGGLTGLLAWPFKFAWNITWTILSYAFMVVSTRRFLTSSQRTPRRQDPGAAAARFLQEFEENYGTEHPDFFAGGYRQALDTAKRELRYFIAILQSDEHDDTPEFCRTTLTSPALISFLRDNDIVVWAGNVRETEGFQVSGTLQATRYPFVAVIVLQYPGGSTSGTPRMSVVDRIEGPSSAETLIQRISQQMEQHSAIIQRLRAERMEREQARALREQQDRAYQESLRADQEKERRAQEAKEAARRAAEEAERLEKMRIEKEALRRQYQAYLATRIPPEPAANEEGARLSLRMMDGERVVRRFRPDDSVMDVYNFVEAYPVLSDTSASSASSSTAQPPKGYEHQFEFLLVTPFPRSVHHPDAARRIRDEQGLWPSANLIVEEVVDE